MDKCNSIRSQLDKKGSIFVSILPNLISEVFPDHKKFPFGCIQSKTICTKKSTVHILNMTGPNTCPSTIPCFSGILFARLAVTLLCPNKSACLGSSYSQWVAGLSCHAPLWRRTAPRHLCIHRLVVDPVAPPLTGPGRRIHNYGPRA